MTDWTDPRPCADARSEDGSLVPPWEAVPREFWERDHWAVRLFDDLFFAAGCRVKPRHDVDGAAALAHLDAAMFDRSLRHEHKRAACAYLLSRWFERPADAPAAGGA